MAGETFASREDFYASDERRRFSGEADFGCWWWEGAQTYSPCWSVSCVAETGEIYAMRRPFGTPGNAGEVVVLGVVAGAGRIDEQGVPAAYREAEDLLDGWAEVCGLTRSFEWVVGRVSLSPPVSFLVRAVLIGEHVHAAVWAGTVAGQRGNCGGLVFRREEWGAFCALLLAGDHVELELDPALTLPSSRTVDA